MTSERRDFSDHQQNLEGIFAKCELTHKSYIRDPLGRIEAQTTPTGTVRYGYIGYDDGPGFKTNTSGQILDYNETLPGGVTVAANGTTQTWSYPCHCLWKSQRNE